MHFRYIFMSRTKNFKGGRVKPIFEGGFET